MFLPRPFALRRDLLYLKDAITHTERVLGYVQGIDLASLPSDTMRMDAVLRNLQIIGEAVKHIPSDLRLQRPEVPWNNIAGLRNLLVHHYFGIDNDIVLDICTNHLSPLLAALNAISKGLPLT